MTSTLGIKKIQYPNGTNSITIDSSGSAAITTANITTANVTNATATGTITTPSINGGQIGGRRNLVINGAMQVAQRATSATGVGGTNEEYPTIDRFNFTTTSAGRFTMTQTADGPTGFANCMKLDCTTADTSISASEALILQTKFEGQDVQQLMYGSSSAQPITVSFYVKGNASATYTLEWRNEEDGRNIGKTFNVTTDWTRVSITFTGDTAGSAVDDDNTHAFTLGIWLHGGTTFSGGTFAENTWHSTHNLRIGDNQTSFLDSTDRTFFITGVQLEVGSQATAFEHRSFGEELALCQRYFELKNGGICNGMSVSTTSIQSGFSYRVPKRASASHSLQGTVYSNDGGVQAQLSGVSQAHGFTNGALLIFTSGAIQNDTIIIFYSQSETTGLAIDAEL